MLAMRGLVVVADIAEGRASCGKVRRSRLERTDYAISLGHVNAIIHLHFLETLREREASTILVVAVLLGLLLRFIVMRVIGAYA